MANNIPIQNIYYMLSYCAGILPEKNEVRVEGEYDTDLLELFADALIRRLKLFIKQGFYKEFVSQQDSLAAIKGKILFKESISESSMVKARLVCRYDEFSEDILHNQILKATILTLLSYLGLKSHYKVALKSIYPYFQHVRVIQLEQKHFDNIRLHRNNQNYHLMLEICQIIYKYQLINEEEGSISFLDFEREKRMNDVFEGFVRNFYLLELRNGFKVGREILNWDIGEVFEGDSSFIPKMQTDICLRNNNTKIIIDTKYYKQPLVKNHNGDEKVVSNNLYQMYSYLSNANKMENMVGILLYPQIDKEINLAFEMNGYVIKILTVNLNQHWSVIKQRLLKIIELNYET